MPKKGGSTPPSEPIPIPTTTPRSSPNKPTPFYTVGRTGFSSSDPTKFLSMAIGPSGLSQYCSFFEYTVEQCAGVEIPPGTGNPNGLFFEINTFRQYPEAALIGWIFCILTVISLGATTFFLCLLLKRRENFQYPIYTVIMHLCLSYSLVAVSQFFLNIPLYLFRIEVNDQLILRQITYFIDQFADFSAVIFYTILAINRLGIMTWKPLQSLFEGKTKNITIGFGWTLALLAAVFTLVYGCRKTYDVEKALFFDDCRPPSLIMYNSYRALFYIYYTLPTISFFLYIFIGISIVIARNGIPSKVRRVEIDLLIQSVITLCLYLAVMGIYFLQLDFGDYPPLVYIFDILINGLEVLTGIIFVLIFAIGNKTVKKAARAMCALKSSIVQPIKTPVVQLRNNAQSAEAAVLEYLD